MANITKTVVFPVPTEWNKDNQDATNVGIATYEGPDKLMTEWYDKDAAAPHNQYVGNEKNIYDVYDPDSKRAERPVALGISTAILDVEQYPLHALAWWGLKYPKPDRIEVVCGPSSAPNPTIPDPHHFTEVFSLDDFYLDQTTGNWSTPVFSYDIIDPALGESAFYGWDHVRRARNELLLQSDSRVQTSDMPAALVQPWLDYRQKLRDLPQDWAGVGTATYLIQFPHDPDELELNKGEATNAKTPSGLPNEGGMIVGDRSTLYDEGGMYNP
tara:strand:+ start:143 stop:955 length:813 start_codon:yes stop_codon:yes gene_type:complete